MALNIKRLLVSQPKPATEKSPYFDIAEKYGVEIDFRPFIKVEPLTSKEFRQQRISILDHTAVIFTARTAIDHFFHLCEDLRVTIPETMKYFCMTEAIAVYLQKYIVYRKRKIFFGQTGKLEDLMTHWQTCERKIPCACFRCTQRRLVDNVGGEENQLHQSCHVSYGQQ